MSTDSKYTEPLGLDIQKYLTLQRQKILEYSQQFDNKVYIEFGGKLLNDSHAVRVLPGYKYNAKALVLSELKDECEIIMCINAKEIGVKRRRDVQKFYEDELLFEVNELKCYGLCVTGIVLTQFVENSNVSKFIRRCQTENLPVYRHFTIHGYPTAFENVISAEGFGKNEFIETTKPVVIVTAPGPNSGKMATCLSQIYGEIKRKNIKAGYAKFETFPVWNLELTHPVNIAYEAATADLNDMNMIDHLYLEATGKKAVSYNRDMKTFGLLKRMLETIFGTSIYHSPTAMGVNQIGNAIINDQIVRQFAIEEIIRRYMQSVIEEKMGRSKMSEVERLYELMNGLGCTEESRIVVKKAREFSEKCGRVVAAIRLYDGTIITGREGMLMTASAAVVMNAVKYLANIPENILLLSPSVIDSILFLNKEFEKNRSVTIKMNIQQTMIALSVSSSANPTAKVALEMLKYLHNCDFHSTKMLTPEETCGLNKIGVLFTSDFCTE